MLNEKPRTSISIRDDVIELKKLCGKHPEVRTPSGISVFPAFSLFFQMRIDIMVVGTKALRGRDKSSTLALPEMAYS